MDLHYVCAQSSHGDTYGNDLLQLKAYIIHHQSAVWVQVRPNLELIHSRPNPHPTQKERFSMCIFYHSTSTCDSETKVVITILKSTMHYLSNGCTHLSPSLAIVHYNWMYRHHESDSIVLQILMVTATNITHVKRCNCSFILFKFCLHQLLSEPSTQLTPPTPTTDGSRTAAVKYHSHTPQSTSKLFA